MRCRYAYMNIANKQKELLNKRYRIARKSRQIVGLTLKNTQNYRNGIIIYSAIRTQSKYLPYSDNSPSCPNSGKLHHSHKTSRKRLSW